MHWFYEQLYVHCNYHCYSKNSLTCSWNAHEILLKYILGAKRFKQPFFNRENSLQMLLPFYLSLKQSENFHY